ncbi:hypothetical protein Scep_025040 [Stephania cephalantha]|uniref:Pectinesterase n=1 Tax=Stephania cephalantha TaxID=152367 RepID=A0AAP0HYZ9_9MAGN
MLNFKNTVRITQAFANAPMDVKKTIVISIFAAVAIPTIYSITVMLLSYAINNVHHDPPSPSPLPPSRVLISSYQSATPTISSHSLRLLRVAIYRTMRRVRRTRDRVSGNSTWQQHLSFQEKSALKDCVEMLDQTLYELRQAVQESRGLREVSSQPLLNELKTLLSAAMTNENSCIEGVSDVEEANPDQQKGLKAYLEGLLMPILAKISDCLAMVNQFEMASRGGQSDGLIEATDFLVWMSMWDRRMRRIAMPHEGWFSFVVASDGSGDFRTIGEAVRMAPNMSLNRVVIKIKAGVYQENVEIQREKTNIMLVGEGMDSTIITSNKNFNDGFSTFNSATLTVIGDRFLARDLTVLNTAGPEKHQAVAVRVTSNAAFYRCNFSSYQDTLYAHSLRQFYRECTIQGTIDFIFGNAAAVFQNCLILVHKPSPGQKNMITAQGREDPNQNTGISLQNCTIVAAPDLAEAGISNFSTFLGRPWRNYSRTMVMKSYLGDLIHPQGWHKWHNYTSLDTVEYIEYMNVGPGSDTRDRVTWGGYKKNCSEDIAKQFTVGMFLHGSDYWLQSTGFPFSYEY